MEHAVLGAFSDTIVYGKSVVHAAIDHVRGRREAARDTFGGVTRADQRIGFLNVYTDFMSDYKCKVLIIILISLKSVQDAETVRQIFNLTFE